MDFDNAKENIMPLAGGRDARCLETVLSAESHHEAMILLQKQREDFEKAIQEYVGDDPLEPWFNYIQWIEQSYPSGGKENGLFDVLNKCLAIFEHDEKYSQDRRMIKLFIKYIDTQPNPQEYYQELYNQGVGTTVADLYICWAYYYDACDNFVKADEVFRKGLDAKAQPLDELEQAHKHFGFSMSQRILYKDEVSSLRFITSMQERRHALTSLRTHKKNVGSVRIGAAVKSRNPGRVDLSSKPSTSSGGNIAVTVFEDENHNPNAIVPSTVSTNSIQEPPTPISVVRSIIDSTRKQENMREPGPWSKARLHEKRKGRLFGNTTQQHELGFEVMEDDNAEYLAPLPKGEDNFSKGIQLPSYFVRKSNPLPKWDVDVYSDPGDVSNTIPMYDKPNLYPRENEVNCIEEHAAYLWFKKRGMNNKFTEKHDPVWTANFDYGFHYYPKFCKKNSQETELITKGCIQDEELSENEQFMFPIKEMFSGENINFSLDEIRFKRWREGKRKLNRNMEETIIMQDDLDETQCVAGATGRDRKSIYPFRRSMMPRFSTVSECRNDSLAFPQARGPMFQSKEYHQDLNEKDTKTGLRNLAQSNLQEENDNKSELTAGSGELENAIDRIRDLPIFDDCNNDEPVKMQADDRILKSHSGMEYHPKLDHDHCFKIPQNVFPIAKQQKIVSHEYRDQAKSLFDQNETCTQTFNLFIKNHAISTPKHIKKTQSHLEQLEVVEKQQHEIDSHAVSPPMQFADAIHPEKPSMGITDPNRSSISALSKVEMRSSKIERQKSNEAMHSSNTEKSLRCELNGSLCKKQNMQLILNENEDRMLTNNQPTPIKIFEDSILNIEPPPSRILPMMVQSHNDMQNSQPIQYSDTHQRTRINSHERIERNSLENADLENSVQIIREFFIFEDGDNDKLDKEDRQDELFRQPLDVLRVLKTRKSVLPTQDDQLEEKPIFAPNETCSTQTFNFFIKNTAISTPINEKKSQSYLPQLQEQQEREDGHHTIEGSSPPTPLTDSDSLSPQFPAKQLSVIMEITEFNTGSSGTKSTAETQDFDSECMKTIQSTKPINFEQDAVLDTIQEVSDQLEDAHIKSINHGNGMISLKVFEDKTETIPKMLLVPSTIPPPSDNFEVLFTTTPPKTNLKVNSSAMNDSMTFSKLVNITVPKTETGVYNQTIGFDTTAGFKESTLPFTLSSNMKKIDSMRGDGLAIGNELTFSDLNSNMSLPPIIMEKDQSKMYANLEKDTKIGHDKSLLQALETTAPIKKEYCTDTSSVKLAANTAMGQNTDHQYNQTEMKSFKIPKDEIKEQSFLFEVNNSAHQSILRTSQIQEASYHIKEELSHSKNDKNSSLGRKSILSRFSAISRRQNSLDVTQNQRDDNEQVNLKSKTTIPMINQSMVWYKSMDKTEEICDLGRSIYVKPLPPNNQNHIWADGEEDDDDDDHGNNQFVYDIVDLDQTKMLIETKMDANINPFDRQLIKAFLDRIQICTFLKNLPECTMVNKVQGLKKGSMIQVADKCFDVMKMVGEGSYGSVFCAKDRSSGKLYAVKQEKPANLWEYYVCLELRSRLSPMVMQCFMNVEYALISNNLSLLVTDFSKYGTLINVCNKIYAATGKNVDEYVVMVMASQLLLIIDHLHASNIIHADIKPDNFLLMSKLTYPTKTPSIQLIDFGVSIDLNLFPPKQTFNYITRTQGFTCIEMLEQRPWTYQPDLFGLAGTIHTLLFGKYMDVERKGPITWGIKTHMPRYFNKTLWNSIFTALLNIRDCDSMPNLQYLRQHLEEEIVEKEKVLHDKVKEFNLYLD